VLLDNGRIVEISEEDDCGTLSSRINGLAQLRQQPPQTYSGVKSAAPGPGVVAAVLNDGQTVFAWSEDGIDYWNPVAERWEPMAQLIRQYKLPRTALQIAANSRATIALLSGEQADRESGLW
jgi:hypothetical protein